MATENNESKWEGKTTTELKNITAAQLWPLFEDFCSIHKWTPTFDSDKCSHVEGAYGEPGLIRHCFFYEQSKWLNEKLVFMDRVQRTLSYEILENNFGFNSYVGTVKVIEADGGCMIEWSFVCDPVEGMRLEELRGFIESNVKALAEEMRKEIEVTVN